MAIKVRLKNEKTGELKDIKVGFSWTLFFFSGFLGIPLFLRKLNSWGTVFLILWAIYLITFGTEFMVIISLISLVLSGWLAIKGNEMTAKAYLEHNWVFANPESDETKYAKGKWGMLG